jgi:hypothetical protein
MTVGGVREAQPDSVQPLPRQPEVRREHRIGAIQPVTDARMPDGGHVHADLVRPAGLQAHLQQAGRPEGLEGVVVRDRRTSVRHDGEAAVAGRVAADRPVDGSPERIGMALHQGVVALVHRPVPESLLEGGVGTLALGDHHHAGRTGVKAVHDALPLGRTTGRHGVAGGQQALEHGRPGPAWCRMRGDPHRLVHDDDVGVLVQDAQARHGFRAGQ